MGKSFVLLRRGGLAIALALVVASCAPRPAPLIATPEPSGVRFFDQGWSDADRQVFTTARQGSSLMPMAWFLALRRTDADAAFAGDQLGRYGYLSAGAGRLPVGFVPDGTASDPQVGMTCAACHTGQLNIKGEAWRIDGGRASADFQAFLTDLGGAARATLDEPARFAAFAASVLGPTATQPATARLRQDFAAWSGRFTDFMGRSLPDPAWGPGRLDAFGMIFNRVVGLDLQTPANYVKADAPVRYPFVWDAPRQDHTQWTGVAPNGTYLRALARNTGEVFGVFGRLDPRRAPFRTAIYDNSVNLSGLQQAEEKLVGLRAPKWPVAAFPLDAALVAEGRALFGENCASCHQITPSPIVRNAWATTLADAGTDRRTFDKSRLMASPGVLTGTRQPPLVGERLADPADKAAILANAVIGSLVKAALEQDPAIRRAIDQDLKQDRLPVLGAATRAPGPAAAVANVTSATKELYKSPSTQPGAVYEARVLTGIWAVGPYLHNGSVASLWELLTPPAARATRFAVGHRDFDPVNVGLEVAAGPGRTMFVVDGSVGNGNGGHEYGTGLPEMRRRALLEYLKTL